MNNCSIFSELFYNFSMNLLYPIYLCKTLSPKHHHLLNLHHIFLLYHICWSQHLQHLNYNNDHVHKRLLLHLHHHQVFPLAHRYDHLIPRLNSSYSQSTSTHFRYFYQHFSHLDIHFYNYCRLRHHRLCHFDPKNFHHLQNLLLIFLRVNFIVIVIIFIVFVVIIIVSVVSIILILEFLFY